jgi:hypothetical protein
MNPMILDKAIRNNVMEGIKQGVPPILIIGMLEAFKMDLHAEMQKQVQPSQIVTHILDKLPEK